MSTEIVLPKMGLTMEEAKVVTWLKDIGDYVEKNDLIMEVETDKANLEVESTGEGYLNVQKVNPGEDVKVGEVIGILFENKDDKEPIEKAISSKEISEQKPVHVQSEPLTEKNESSKRNSVQNGDPIRVSPSARKLARIENIDLKAIVGSGPRGRIILKDVQANIDKSKLQEAVVQTPVVPEKNEGDKIVSLTAMRKVIAKRMAESTRNIPQFQLTRDVDTTKVNETRKNINALNGSDMKLSLNDFIIQASALALQQHASVNASFVEDTKDPYILEKKDINIGLAVAVEGGLVVPVIHRANELSLGEIAKQRYELTEKAQAGKLTPEEMSGGTFTISNLGGYNIEAFTAIVNPPESGILAVGKAKLTPIVDENMEISIKPIMKVTASFDHRMIDGALGAQFIHSIVEQLQSTKWKLI